MSADNRLTGGQLAAAISNAVVRITADYTGRGPTQARTTIGNDTISVHLRDALTKAERRLSERGEGEWVLQTRHKFQHAMREDLVAAVTALSGRKVIAFMSDSHLDPDMAVEFFVLEAGEEPDREVVEA
jgi:uncharacterized protein YbcI